MSSKAHRRREEYLHRERVRKHKAIWVSSTWICTCGEHIKAFGPEQPAICLCGNIFHMGDPRLKRVES